MHIEEIMKNIDIYETHISGKNGKRVKMAILRATVPPIELNAIKEMMDLAVIEYVKTVGHNTFVEEHGDTPNLRIIISDLNSIEFSPYSDEHLK